MAQSIRTIIYHAPKLETLKIEALDIYDSDGVRHHLSLDGLIGRWYAPMGHTRSLGRSYHIRDMSCNVTLTRERKC